MKKHTTLLLAAGLALSGSAALAAGAPAADAVRETARQFFQPIPTPESVIKERNISADSIELGRWLFFEPRLSRSHIISCNTCHSVGTGGADNIQTSIGHGWQHGPRNSPTVLNALFNGAQFWDGRAADLKEQAKGPVQASVEMNNTPSQVEETLKSLPEYVALFQKAYPKDKDPVNFENMAHAIEAFESTLLTPNSKFDQFLAGADSLDEIELKGLDLFMSKGCVACHQGINVGGQGYFPFGVVKKPGAEILPPDDKGRFTVTHTASDEYVFRAGPLRNIALTAPYFHSGDVWSLEQAVAIMGSSQLGQELNEGEVKAITRFLHTLTGEQPQVVYPILPPSTAATPRPQK
ncbi:Cytochrome c551 peroxidase [Castellaniella defragrans 65Phen]|uniref:Cytochrome c551 peroxidase n=2 Tax=Castellaniella defragrans TaxID=75697 RepID=W8WTH0_CASD6|nr:cytochrome-c peroxidase [Castellaniella defragrans]KAB0604008.1 cytochrome-c peroxidase [Castellaniella defragrans]MBB6082233.1 cytochrome c peroxidase [Castellaniella defragrans]CDM22829.1 Cytochrome c551 peroxidase [Castellaniella defragrans 65Phen]